jgi:chaperonin cofactor prefoldin
MRLNTQTIDERVKQLEKEVETLEERVDELTKRIDLGLIEWRALQGEIDNDQPLGTGSGHK